MNRREFLQLAGVSALSGGSILSACASLVDQTATSSTQLGDVAGRLDVVHRALDHTSEERLGNEKVGTTLRGIGPAYEDKVGRRGLRVADALDSGVLRSRIERNLEDANRIIVAYGGEPLEAKTIIDDTSAMVERLAPFICDTTHFLNLAAAQGRSILLCQSPGVLRAFHHTAF
jgi:adenylosuccinate synthase